jgi:FkbM family methyltransferase
VINAAPNRDTLPDINDLHEFKPNLQIQTLTPDESLDAFASSRHIRRVPLLNIAPSCSTISTLRGTVSLLEKRRIDVVRFTHGPACRETGECFFDLSCFLLPWGFFFLQVLPTRAIPMPPVLPGQQQAPGIYLAVSVRFVTLFSQQKDEKSLVDVQGCFKRFGFSPRGVVHVGAHHAEELGLYKQMGFQRILFIEANPDLANEVRQKTAADPSVMVANVAASDQDGQTTLNITSNDMSSSILPLKKHQQYYPNIQVTRQATVPMRRVDTLLAELHLNPADFNYLHLDIQGSELMALHGASGLLEHIDALTTEVNFEELYAGCGRAEDIDDLLRDRGFSTETIVCPYHASWGDAFYHRPPQRPAPNAPKRGTVTMSSIGKNGRFANQLYQYAFLRLLAERNHFAVQTSLWIGQRLFALTDPPISHQFPMLAEGHYFPDSHFPAAIIDSIPANCELHGFFQYDTIHYAPHKEFIRNLFTPAPHITQAFNEAFARLQLEQKTLVCIHLRRGDYGTYNAKHYEIAPTSWYRKVLDPLWPTLNNPVLYIASDEIQKVLPDFADYHPLTAADLGLFIPEAPYFPDFYMLTQANILFISNSSFSFFAALLNRRANRFYRPNLCRGHLLPFDPWNAVPLLHRDEGGPMWRPAPAPVSKPAAPAAPPPGVKYIARTTSGAPVVTFGRKP